MQDPATPPSVPETLLFRSLAVFVVGLLMSVLSFERIVTGDRYLAGGAVAGITGSLLIISSSLGGIVVALLSGAKIDHRVARLLTSLLVFVPPTVACAAGQFFYGMYWILGIIPALVVWVLCAVWSWQTSRIVAASILQREDRIESLRLALFVAQLLMIPVLSICNRELVFGLLEEVGLWKEWS